ncbi:hypothetical protein ACOMHN_029483 [Nucella lapillus]
MSKQNPASFKMSYLPVNNAFMTRSGRMLKCKLCKFMSADSKEFTGHQKTAHLNYKVKCFEVYDMASATSSSLRVPGVRKVTFAPSATVYLFDRQVMLDRWPRDGGTIGLGMQANHFLTEEHPLEDPEVHPRGSYLL